MHDMMYTIYDIMNRIKGFTVGFDYHENKMLFEVDGKRYVVEVREVDEPKPDIRDDMRRIRYL
jgi:hypothetical protein